MSTRADVDCGEHYYLHADFFEAGKVYLQLSGPGIEFRAYPDSIVVAIPAAVWEKIRLHPIADFERHWVLIDDDGAAAESVTEVI